MFTLYLNYPDISYLDIITEFMMN